MVPRGKRSDSVSEEVCPLKKYMNFNPFANRPTTEEFEQRLATKADNDAVWEKAEELTAEYQRLREAKADDSRVTQLEKKLIAKLRVDSDAISNRLDKTQGLMDKLPKKLQESVQNSLQSLCDTQFREIERVCKEIAALEQQTRLHAEAAVVQHGAVATAAQKHLETLQKLGDDVKQHWKEAEGFARNFHTSWQQTSREVAIESEAAREVAEKSFQSLCDTRFGAIEKICAEIAELEKQTRAHSEAANACERHTIASAQTNLDALHKLHEDFERSREAADHAARNARESWAQACKDATASAEAGRQAFAQAVRLAIAETQSLFEGCDTFWGRLRWLFRGSRQGKCNLTSKITRNPLSTGVNESDL